MKTMTTDQVREYQRLLRGGTKPANAIRRVLGDDAGDDLVMKTFGTRKPTHAQLQAEIEKAARTATESERAQLAELMIRWQHENRAGVQLLTLPGGSTPAARR